MSKQILLQEIQHIYPFKCFSSKNSLFQKIQVYLFEIAVLTNFKTPHLRTPQKYLF